MRINRHKFLRFIESASAATQEGGNAGSAGTGTPTADTHEGYDFPDNTAISDMTTEQKAEYWRHKSRKHEDAEKRLQTTLASQSDYADLKKSAEDAHTASLSDQEKLVEQARLEGENLGADKYRSIAVKYALRAAATAAGIPAAKEGEEDPLGTILDTLDTTKLLTDDGEVDEAKVAKIVAPFAHQPQGESRQGEEDPFLGAVRRAANGGSTASAEELEKQYKAKYQSIKEH